MQALLPDKIYVLSGSNINLMFLGVEFMTSWQENEASEKEVRTAREMAFDILKEAEEKNFYLNLLLNKKLSAYKLSQPERNFLTELTYGVVQRLNTLDWVLSLYLKYPLKKLTPSIRIVLRIGVYQLLYLDRVPASAAVNEAVKMAHRYGHRGVAGLVNAVLRKVNVERDNLPWPERSKKDQFLSLYYSYPLWMIRRWMANMGEEEVEAFCRTGNTVPPLTVRTNTMILGREELKNILDDEGVETTNCIYAEEGLHLKLSRRLSELPSFQKGYFHIQGESSMLVSHLLNPQPGEKILDLCSAPGGKTTHLATIMANQGNILAGDIYSQRLKLVDEAARRQGLRIIQTEKIDGRSVPPSMHDSFHRVLLDVPCSGLGVIRRKADLKWRRQPDDINSLAALQLELLKGAFKALCPGGVLIYSACTLEPEETREVVESFLRLEESAQRSVLSTLLPTGLKEEEREEGMVNLLPHRHDLDGFFIARIRKKL